MLKADRPFSLVLFGASGHLAKIKIFPALYFLALKKRLPSHWSLVGFARTPMTDASFREHIASSVREHVSEVNAAVLEEFLGHCFYSAGDYSSTEDFQTLATKLSSLEAGEKNVVRLAYLSIPPSAFTATIENLCKGGVHEKGKEFRCIVEKPVGHDLASFEAVMGTLTCFRSDEIYILDHYLGKEAARNTYYLRHANPVIESLLSSALVSHVQITAAEAQGLEGRAGYFDAVGTLRDMFQSHLLQIGALLTMPLVSDAAEMKASRLAALKQFHLPKTSKLSEVIVQGQYAAGKDSVAYRSEPGVAPTSRTATYAAVRLMTSAPKWKGVPFFLRSGKRLSKKETRIAIEFKDSPVLAGKESSKNRLDIILQGEAGMKLYLQTKLGGSEPKFRPLVMEDPLVCMGDCLVEHSLLLLEAVSGMRGWYLDPEEVRASWKLVDPLQAFLDDPKTPLHLYPAGSEGPADAGAFIGAFGHRWL